MVNRRGRWGHAGGSVCKDYDKSQWYHSFGSGYILTNPASNHHWLSIKKKQIHWNFNSFYINLLGEIIIFRFFLILPVVISGLGIYLHVVISNNNKAKVQYIYLFILQLLSLSVYNSCCMYNKAGLPRVQQCMLYVLLAAAALRGIHVLWCVCT